VCDYLLFQNDTIISQFVSELCGFWEQAKSEDFTKKLNVSRESGQDLDERFVKTHLLEFFTYNNIIYGLSVTSDFSPLVARWIAFGKQYTAAAVYTI